METTKSKQSQISKILAVIPFSAIGFWGERATLWSLLIALFWVNVFMVQKMPQQLFPVFSPALSNPFSASTHTRIAVNLWNQGFQRTAKNELLLAQELYQNTSGSVLGTTTDPSTLLTRWEGKPVEVKRAYEYWKSVISQKPDYRDGRIMTALYAYALGNTKEAVALLQKTQNLDPNFQPLNDLLGKIQK